MKIRVVSSREEISTLNPDERVVHMAFRPSNKDIFGLVETCPKIEVIQLPQSYKRKISKSVEMFLQMRKIQFIEGDIWAHRKDMDEYYSIPYSMIEKIRRMKIEGKSSDIIGEKVSGESKLNREILTYMVTKGVHA
ncbi:MAG: DUF1699 family protein [Alphaproteobacteria bacterium]|nr:MAG: DUF1699 family protein [Alphaproteobacteria bacterium]